MSEDEEEGKSGFQGQCQALCSKQKLRLVLSMLGWIRATNSCSALRLSVVAETVSTRLAFGFCILML